MADVREKIAEFLNHHPEDQDLLNDATDGIFAIIRDVMLSEEVIETVAIELWQDAPVGLALPGVRWDTMKPWVQDNFRLKAREAMQIALKGAGIVPKPQVYLVNGDTGVKVKE